MGAAKGKEVNPKVVTINGRLSFPVWTAKESFEKSQGGNYPAKDIQSAKPEFNLLVEQAQLDKIRDWVVDHAMPYWVERAAAGEAKDKLAKDEADALIEQISKPDFGGKKAIYNTPFKAMSDKSLAMAPECVASIKLIGNAGVDMVLKAAVYSESELVVPDPTRVDYPVVLPVNETVHDFYPGCYVAVTCNLYAYFNGKLPGFSAGASTAVFKADADRFGGGVAVDENEIFAD